MYKCTLVRLASLHKNIRTSEVEGVCLNLPKVGESFIVVAPKFVKWADHRIVYTTIIENIECEENGWTTFHTINSVYKVKVDPTKIVGRNELKLIAFLAILEHELLRG